MAYALQVDALTAIELAALSAGADTSPGAAVEEFDQWLASEPEPFDQDKARLLTALGVAP